MIKITTLAGVVPQALAGTRLVDTIDAQRARALMRTLNLVDLQIKANAS